MNFDGSQVIIGKGAQADVFRYHGYAYKVYKDTYPAEWIAFEKHQQAEVNNAGLTPVRYYDTDDPHIIKMDLIDGVELEKKMLAGFEGGFEILAEAFRRVHKADITGIGIPRLSDTAGLFLKDDERSVVLPVIRRLSEKMPSCICHLDMHFLNIMIPSGPLDITDGFLIIDWMNTRIAPSVFDYARTYVILAEYAKEIIEPYMKAVAADMEKEGISEEDFKDAVTVCMILRKKEKD